MEVTECSVRLVKTETKLRAYATIVLDNELCIHSVRVIETPDGILIAMPNDKMSSHCANCNENNHLRANYCNRCGNFLGGRDKQHPKLFADIVHPVRNELRLKINDVVITEYNVQMAYKIVVQNRKEVTS